MLDRTLWIALSWVGVHPTIILSAEDIRTLSPEDERLLLDDLGVSVDMLTDLRAVAAGAPDGQWTVDFHGQTFGRPRNV